MAKHSDSAKKQLFFEREWSVQTEYALDCGGYIVQSDKEAKVYRVSNEVLHRDILASFLNVKDWATCREFLDMWGLPVSRNSEHGQPQPLPLAYVISSAEALRFIVRLHSLVKDQDSVTLEDLFLAEELYSDHDEAPQTYTFTKARKLKNEVNVSFAPVSNKLWQGAIGFTQQWTIDERESGAGELV